MDQSELENLKVYGETLVGWDEKTVPNETVDEHGNFTSSSGFAIHDPSAPPRRVYDAPDVVALRSKLKDHNGIDGLDICDPDETVRIARIFRRDGFVVVRDILNSEQLARFREGSARVLKDILSIPGIDGRKYITESGRLPHRYSYGTASSSRHMLHDQVWASMIDLPTITPILIEMFGTDDYYLSGGGGDLCLPGAIEYQHLHSDFFDRQAHGDERLAYVRQVGLLKIAPGKSFAELDMRTQRLVMDRTPPSMTVNFLMSDLNWENGPIRQIPGTHTSMQSPPSLEEEPNWMRWSTLVGAPAGSGVFRDHRAWHGATPNLSKEVRSMPNLEYVPAWNSGAEFMKSMPYEIWEGLTPHAQNISRRIKEKPGVWPLGAGVMHPLAQKRKEVSGVSKSEIFT
ncbi:MAG: phytanoyl-CoA dioxygenase family protein [Pseudomonadales bacterium]